MALRRVSYGKSITTLSEGTPLRFSYSVAAKVGNCDPENTVGFLLLEMFSKSPLFSDLRVTGKANQRDRPVRKPAV